MKVRNPQGDRRLGAGPRAILPMRLIGALACILLFSIAGASFARDNEQVTRERARTNFARPVVLGPDDVRAFPDAPAGFRDVHAGGAQGQVLELAYDSAITGTLRRAQIYLPTVTARPNLST